MELYDVCREAGYHHKELLEEAARRRTINSASHKNDGFKSKFCCTVIWFALGLMGKSRRDKRQVMKLLTG